MHSCQRELNFLAEEQDKIKKQDWSDRMVDPPDTRRQYEVKIPPPLTPEHSSGVDWDVFNHYQWHTMRVHATAKEFVWISWKVNGGPLHEPCYFDLHQNFKNNNLLSHESEVNKVQEEGDRLIELKHPASATIQVRDAQSYSHNLRCQRWQNWSASPSQAQRDKVRNEWQKFLNLCICQETHLDNVEEYKRVSTSPLAEYLFGMVHYRPGVEWWTDNLDKIFIWNYVKLKKNLTVFAGALFWNTTSEFSEIDWGLSWNERVDWGSWIYTKIQSKIMESITTKWQFFLRNFILKHYIRIFNSLIEGFPGIVYYKSDLEQRIFRKYCFVTKYIRKPILSSFPTVLGDYPDTYFTPSVCWLNSL